MIWKVEQPSETNTAVAPLPERLTSRRLEMLSKTWSNVSLLQRSTYGLELAHVVLVCFDIGCRPADPHMDRPSGRTNPA